jgi:hypothetical protein
MHCRHPQTRHPSTIHRSNPTNLAPSAEFRPLRSERRILTHCPYDRLARRQLYVNLLMAFSLSSIAPQSVLTRARPGHATGTGNRNRQGCEEIPSPHAALVGLPCFDGHVGQTPVSALLKRSHWGDPDGQTQGSAPTPERCHIGVSPVHPGCGSAGMGAFVGTIRMGRHRGLPLHRNAATSGSPRSIQAAGALGWAHSWGLSKWADTEVCPYTGPQSRGAARSIQVSAARHYLDGQARGLPLRQKNSRR